MKTYKVYYAYGHPTKQNKIGCTFRSVRMRAILEQGYAKFSVLESGEWTPEQAEDKETAWKIVRGLYNSENENEDSYLRMLNMTNRRTPEAIKKRESNEEYKKVRAEKAKKSIKLTQTEEAWNKRRQTKYFSEFRQKLSDLKSVAIHQYTLGGIYIKTWKSLTEVQNNLNIPVSQLCSTLKGRFKSTGGYMWRYAKDLEAGIPIPKHTCKK